MNSVSSIQPLQFLLCGSQDSDRRALLGHLAAAVAEYTEYPGEGQAHHFATSKRRFAVQNSNSPEDLLARSASASVTVLLSAAYDLEQAQRHMVLSALLNIRKIVVALDQIDVIEDTQKAFEHLEEECRAFAESLELDDIRCIPVSALHGDNIAAQSSRTPWYQGPSLLDYLESVDALDNTITRPFRLLVERFERGGFVGQIVSGSVRLGDRLRVLPAGKESSVQRIMGLDNDLESAHSGHKIIIQLADELAPEDTEVLAAKDAPPGMADQFEAAIIWRDQEPMLPGRSYWLQRGGRTVGLAMHPKYRLNVHSQEHLAAKTLEQGEIGICNLNLEHDIVFDEYRDNPALGGFVLLDPQSKHPVGVGLLHFALRRSQNIHWQAIEINKKAHSGLKEQRPCVIWFTGLSGAGKSTIANLVEKKLHGLGRHTYLLDGDNVRHGLNQDLGFTEADRVENIRRIAEVSKLMVDAGLIVLTSFISPFQTERRMARDLLETDEFCEVFIDTPLTVAEQRDTKGLYKKARRGELKNFTGIDSPYEPPEQPEIHIDTTQLAPADAAEKVVEHLQAMGIVGE